MTPIAVKDLLEAGVHFGHQTKRWNPKMKPFIFGERNGIYIIDLGKTAKLFREAEQFVSQIAAAGRTVLLSSHQISEVERVADIVVIIKQGKLLAIEKLDDLKNHTRELTLTINNGAPYLSDVPGEVICGREHERQWRLLVRHPDGKHCTTAGPICCRDLPAVRFHKSFHDREPQTAATRRRIRCAEKFVENPRQ